MEDKRVYYTMGEVCEMFDLQASTVRYWEREFPLINPTRNAKGNRLFDKKSLESLRLVYHLIKERGMTLEGAKKSIKNGNITTLNREAELLERLMNIRTTLVEVREELKGEHGELVDEAALFEETKVGSEEGAVQHSKESEPTKEEAAQSMSKPRRGRRRKDDTEKSRELFAYFEQQLF